MQFQGTGTRLTDADFTRAGQAMGCGEDEVHAVVDVEAAGRGFDSQRRPKMLFEKHHFYKHLPVEKRAIALSAGLASTKWEGPGSYPQESYSRLERAMKIDEDAALKSCSWGLGQILGDHYKLLGYPTPAAMVQDAMDGEGRQLQQMVKFIKAKGLDRHLRVHNWAAFARGYNGAGYAANRYDTKLADAYRRWSGIPDTVVHPPKPTELTASQKSATGAAAGGTVVAAGTAAQSGDYKLMAIIIVIGVILVGGVFAYNWYKRRK